jgi:N-acetylmuramoyl-L-alanine amidase
MIFSRQINNISLNSLLILSLLFLFSFFSFAAKSQKSASSGLSTIIIDAGHGGKDPGAVVGNAREKDIVLDIALKLGKLINKGLPNVKVIYTRKADYFVPLFKRSVIANNQKADLFISIHANYCPSSSIKGTETYVLGLHRSQENLDVAKKENSVILLEEDYSKRYEGFDPKSTESYIMFELIQDNYLEQSLSFARMVQSIFRNHAGRSNRDVRQAGFLVLRETAMPSVLIETGYLSNKEEAAYLMTVEGRETIASAIYKSIKDYKSKFDTRLNYAVIDRKNAPNEKEYMVSSPAKKDTEKTTSPKKSKTAVKISSPAIKEQTKEKENTVKNHLSSVKNESGKEIENTVNDSSKNDIRNNEPAAITAEPRKKEASGKKNPAIQNAFNGQKNNPEKSSYQESQDEYTYAIQIAASLVKLPKTFRLFKGIENIKEIKIAGYYKYYCSETSSRSETARDLPVLKKRIPDVFMVRMKNGVPTPLRDIPVHKRK